MLTPRRALIAALLLSFCLNVYGITWGLPDARGWAPDEIFPGQVLEGMRSYFSFGWHYTYPALHFVLLAACYLPFIKLHQLGVIGGDLNFTLFLVGRGLTVLMSLGALYFLYECARRLYNEWVGVMAVLILALTPQYVYYSKTVNLDIPDLFWFLWSMVFYVKILEQNRNENRPGNLLDYLGLAITAAFAVCTKDQAAGMYLTVPPLLFLSELVARRAREQTFSAGSVIKTLFSRQNIYAGVVAALLFVLLHNWIFNWSGFLKHLDIIMGKESRARYYMFENDFDGHVGLFFQMLRSYVFCLGLPALFLCLVGAFVDFKERGWRSNTFYFLTSAVVFYVMIIRPILYNVDRYFIPIVAFLAIFGGFAAVKLTIAAHAELERESPSLWHRLTPRLTVFLLGVILGWSFLRANSINLQMVSDSRYVVESWFRDNVPANSTVHLFSRNYYMPRLHGYQTKPGHPALAHLGQMNDSWAVVSAREIARYKPRSPGYQFYKRMLEGTTKCGLRYRYQAHPHLDVLSPPFDLTNLAKVNPDLWIYYCPRQSESA